MGLERLQSAIGWTAGPPPLDAFAPSETPPLTTARRDEKPGTAAT